ncbi:hypothetical protein B0T19DRAFT_271593 [Cercophora scortea]|uniref:Uncharacterized protein n=1 Tax=Cercophora scortea TaxID=314031 RepID=A0AAE0M5I9_9PEZI|nr:hypothetical protein B0T19DRAFT_271593 [Cercophora scortea]
MKGSRLASAQTGDPNLNKNMPSTLVRRRIERPRRKNRPSYTPVILKPQPSGWIDGGNEEVCRHEKASTDQTSDLGLSDSNWGAFMPPTPVTDYLLYSMDATAWTGDNPVDLTNDDNPKRQQQEQQQPPRSRLDTSEGRNRCENDTRSGSPEERGQRPLLACPFFRSNPLLYHDCQHLKLRRIKDVKQHIGRRHQDDRYQCSCSRDIPAGKGRRRCSYYDGPDGAVTTLSDEQRKRLSDHYTSRNKSIESQWYQIWRIIFPCMKPPRAIYMGVDRRQQVDSLRSFWLQKRSELVSSAVDKLLPGSPCMLTNRVLLFWLMDSLLDQFEAQMSGSGSGNGGGHEETRESTVECAITPDSETGYGASTSTLAGQDSRAPSQATSKSSTGTPTQGFGRSTGGRQPDTIDLTMDSESSEDNNPGEAPPASVDRPELTVSSYIDLTLDSAEPEAASVSPQAARPEFDNVSNTLAYYHPASNRLENDNRSVLPLLGVLPELTFRPQYMYQPSITSSYGSPIPLEPPQPFTPSLASDSSHWGSPQSLLSLSVSPYSGYQSSQSAASVIPDSPLTEYAPIEPYMSTGMDSLTTPDHDYTVGNPSLWMGSDEGEMREYYGVESECHTLEGLQDEAAAGLTKLFGYG